MQVGPALVLMIGVLFYNAECAQPPPPGSPKSYDLKDRVVNAAMKFIALDGLEKINLPSLPDNIVVISASSTPTVAVNNLKLVVNTEYKSCAKPCSKNSQCTLSFKFESIKPVLVSHSCYGLLGRRATKATVLLGKMKNLF